MIMNMICLPRQPGDVLPPVPRLVEGAVLYEYIMKDPWSF